MRILNNGKINYKKLDDDVSFQLLRTNPRLTTNTKLMYDGDAMYLESYDADPLLSTQKYKNKRVWRSGLFNNDIKNFLSNTGETAYALGKEMDDIIVGDSYDNQFENIYWCGCESINSKAYDQEFGLISPLYLKKKLPDYFVIFKIVGPSNMNMNPSYVKMVEDYDGSDEIDEMIVDDTFDFNEDILNKSTIIKSFDLREGTPIGDYIRRYTNQLNFEYDKPIYVNYSSKEIYYYGIDKYTGLLTKKIENFEEELLKNDNTIIHDDDWITNGFVRNNLIYPYIINLEFLFNDDEADEYTFCRYYGMYCNGVDLLEFDDLYNDAFLCDKDTIYYLKDKNNDLYTLQKFIYSERERSGVNAGNYYLSAFKPENYYPDKYGKYPYRDSKGLRKSDNTYGFLYEFKYINYGKFDIGDIDYFNFGYKINSNYNGNINNGYCILSYHKKAVKAFTTSQNTNFIYPQSSRPESKKMTNVVGRTLDESLISGYEKKSINAYCDYINGLGYATYVFTFNKLPQHGDKIKIYDTLYSEIEPIHTFTAEGIIGFDENHIPIPNVVGAYRKHYYSCTGTVESTARAFCECLDLLPLNSRLINAYYLNNMVVLKCISSGTKYNNRIRIEFDEGMLYNNVVNVDMPDYWFSGGTDNDFCLFKVRKDDLIIFKGEGNNDRVIKTPDGYDNAHIISSYPYIDEFDSIDDEYYVIATDDNGKHVKISSIKQVQILDEFHPVIGMFNFFPIKDFDFDMTTSVYGLNNAFVNEINNEKIRCGRFFDDDCKEIKTEYDYYLENLLPSLCTVSRTVPYISKWGYVNGLDSCENPYRLNMSKIFGSSNFSSNIFVIESDNAYYTHDMPYYMTTKPKDKDLINEYQYIYKLDDIKTTYKSNEFIKKWKTFFEDNNVDNFSNIFIQNTNNGELNKRFKKKYSIFKYGDSYFNPNTLFRGIKFESIEMVMDNKGKYIEKNSSKYNDYKFSFVYIPYYYNEDVVDMNFDNCVHFVKNDTFKFIVGIVFFNTIKECNEFNKSMVYKGAMSIDVYNESDKKELLKSFGINQSIDNDDVIISKRFNELFFDNNDDVIDVSKLLIKSPMLDLIISKLLSYVDDDSDFYDSEIFTCIDSIEFTYYDENGDKKVYVEYNGDEIFVEKGIINIYSPLKSTVIKRYDNIEVCIKIKLTDYEIDMILNNIVQSILTMYSSASTRNIKLNINNEYSVNYNSDDFKIKIIEPETVETYDIFRHKLLSEGDDKSVITSVDISLKDDSKKLAIQLLNRYSGYYEPIFKDIVFFNDLKYNNTDKIEYFLNTTFDKDYKDAYGSFGIINNMFYHKINEDNPNDIVTSLNPYYPITGQYALGNKDYNIFNTNWDMKYFTKQKDISTTEDCNYIAGMKDEKCMFGSKYMNLPNRIENSISEFNGICDWNDDWIKDDESCPYEVMYRENLNGNSVDFYLFLRKRIIRYFCELKEIKDEFNKYVNIYNSYGLKNTLDDDIREYVEKNIIDLYELENVYVWIKQIKRGVYDYDIDNDYTKYIDYSEKGLIKDGFERNKTIRIQKINVDEFDRKITYNLHNGIQEYFGFSFVIKRK